MPVVVMMQAIMPATAQAAHMAAQIYAEYPGIWPETVRALMIHSAISRHWLVERTKLLG